MFRAAKQFRQPAFSSGPWSIRSGWKPNCPLIRKLASKHCKSKRVLVRVWSNGGKRYVVVDETKKK